MTTKVLASISPDGSAYENKETGWSNQSYSAALESSAGSTGPYLQSANNLSDVSSAATSLSHLGGFSSTGGTISGLVSENGGNDTSGTATFTGALSFTTTQSQQLSTVQDVILYIFVNTAITATVAMGSTNSAANSIVPSTALSKGVMITIRVPKGWWINITCGTMADLTICQVTC